MKDEFNNWKRYLKLHKIGGGIDIFKPNYYGMCVVIPCYNEPDLLQTIENLWQADEPKEKTAVIVVVNSGENAANNITTQNKYTYSQLIDFANANKNAKLTLIPLFYEKIRKKHAGVGYARKIGMDYAIWLFEACRNIDGIIVSLDADCKVEKNYFNAIYKAYSHQSVGISTHYFEHPVEHVEHSEAIVEYELYLRYFKWALWFSGFPYPIHTVGSSFSLKADVYVKHGGMNRKQGGEDFYFLHKIVPHEKIGTINGTTVYPSARVSERVPFGTGPALQQMINTKENYHVYALKSFIELKRFFDNITLLYYGDDNTIKRYLTSLAQPIQEFLRKVEFEKWVDETKANVSSEDAFKKRLLSNFNAFKTVQFLNEAHSSFYKKQPILSEAVRLLSLMEVTEVPTKAIDVLQIYREMDKGL